MDKEQLLNTKIEELNFSTRTYHCLKNAHIKTLRELISTNKKELMKLKNFGHSCWCDVSFIVHSFGLKFTYEEELDRNKNSNSIVDSQTPTEKYTVIKKYYNLKELLKERKELQEQAQNLDKKIEILLNSIMMNELDLEFLRIYLKNNDLDLDEIKETHIKVK